MTETYVELRAAPAAEPEGQTASAAGAPAAADSLTPARILQTGMGFWASKVLLSAVELELFTALRD